MRLGAAALTASATLTAATAASVVVTAAASLTAAATLTTAATDTTSAAVSLVATSFLTPAARAGAPLGVVTMAAGPTTAVSSPQPGTLANPYPASSSDTRSISFANALFVATEPVAATGPAAAPSMWYQFTEAQVANLTASASGFLNGASIELYSGPPGAGPDDLTFIATDGSVLVTLGAVTLSALAAIAAPPLRAASISLSAQLVAGPAVAVVLS